MATQILGQEGINYVRSTNPAYRLREVDQTAPAGMWQMDASSGDLLFQCATAADWSAFTTVVTMTSAPSITIHGTITFSGTIVFSANVRLDDDIVILFGDGSDYYMGYSATADVLEIGTGATINSNVAMVVDSSGRIGMGTSDPSIAYSAADNLVVSQPGGVNVGMSLLNGYEDGSLDNVANAVYFGSTHASSSLYQGYILYNFLADDMRFGVGASLAFELAGADQAATFKGNVYVEGDVGIGNDDPVAPLEVTGAVYAGRNTADAGNSGSFNAFNDSGATLQLKNTSSTVSANNRVGRSQYTTKDSNLTYAGEFNLKAYEDAASGDAPSFFNMLVIPQNKDGSSNGNLEEVFKFYARENTVDPAEQIHYPVLGLNNSRNGATWGDGDIVGSIEFLTEDGSTSYPTVSAIRSISDDDPVGTPAGSLGFYTAQAAGEIAERMFISRLGWVLINGGTLRLNETANNQMQINPTNTQSVPSGAGNQVTISSFTNAGSGGGLVVVVGCESGDSGVQFVDLVLLGSNGYNTISSLDARGSPDGRQYSATANTDLQLYMDGSSSYDVQTMNLMGSDPS